MIDSVRLEHILKENSFRSEDFRAQASFFMADEPNEDFEEVEKVNSGVWITPSYFRHSCVPNAQRIFLKDFVTFYALQDIKKGDMLTCVFYGVDSDIRLKGVIYILLL